MRLIMKVGYKSFLFGKGANVSELISTFDSVMLVTEKGYGNDRRYIIAEEEHPGLIIVPDDSISLPENQSDFLDKYHQKAEECDKLSIEVYALTKQIEDMKKVAETITKT